MLVNKVTEYNLLRRRRTYQVVQHVYLLDLGRGVPVWSGHGCHHVSMLGLRLPSRGPRDGKDFNPRMIHRRDSAGSITLSISKSSAMPMAEPFSYIPATRRSYSACRSRGRLSGSRRP